MELINVERQNTHGGSLRYICGRKNVHKISKNVEDLLVEEKKKNLDNSISCFEFKKNCEDSKLKLREKLYHHKSLDKKICGYAATSKSTTILNYCDIGLDVIDYICDTTKDKIGKFTPRTHIPIVNINHFHNNIPDYTFLFAWNHKKEIFNKEKKILNKTKWIAHINI